jgi:predicted flap endonuclease-1-like 5' DNA nuclease
MPELSVSEEQLQRLESVREDLEAAYVGPYGTISREEAFEYLLDTYTPPSENDAEADEATADTGDGSAEPDDGTTATDAEPETTATDAEPDSQPAGDLTDIAGVGEATAEALVDAGFGSIAAVRDADPAALTDADGIGEKQAIDIKAEVADFDGPESDTGAAGEVEADDTEANPGPGESEGESPENTLQQAMSLLDQHDDKWRESSGDEPYEVDLPDGGTEAVRTKDDIKRLLFKHWR